MNRSYFALFVALLIHFVLLLIFWLLGSMLPELQKTKADDEKRIKIALKEMPPHIKKKKIKDVGPKKEPPIPSKIAPPMPKGSQLKEIEKSVKTEPIPYKPEKIEQKPKVRKQPINIPKPKPQVQPKPKVKELPSKKKHIELKPKAPKPKPKKEPDPFDWLKEDKSNEEVKKEEKKVDSGSKITNDIKELYGDEFGKLTPGQQKYILDNREIMRRITQEILTRVARVNISRDINVNRVNVVEFYLHPNGDMSDFKFLKKSGYYVLDDTTKETIEYAYSRYPRPKEKILIRYNVFYNLARY